MNEQLQELGEELRTQDNRATAEPVFLLQQKVRAYGFMTDYCSDTVKLASVGDEIVEASELDRETISELWTEDVGYRDHWEVMPGFIYLSAKRAHEARNALKDHAEYHRGIRVWCASLSGSSDLRDVRRGIMVGEVTCGE